MMCIRKLADSSQDELSGRQAEGTGWLFEESLQPEKLAILWCKVI